MKSVFARSLFKSYDGINAVDGIDLDVDEGQIFGFLGPNGAGKSTVIKLLTTLIQPTSGKISVLEIDTAKEPLSIRKKIKLNNDQVIKLAYKIEREILGYDGGWQDQIMATLGGIRKILINKNGKIKCLGPNKCMDDCKLSVFVTSTPSGKAIK